MKELPSVVILVALVPTLTGFLQKTEVVEAKVLFATISTPRALRLTFAFGLAVVTGIVGGFLLRKSGIPEAQK